MTLFGLIWCLFLFISLFLDIKYLFALTIISSVLQCDNVLVINNSGIGPQIVTSILFVFKVLILYKKKNNPKKVNKSFKQISIMFLILIFICFLSSIINNVFDVNYLRNIQLFSYFICFLCMYHIGDDLSEDYIYNLMRGLTIFLIIEGFIQLLITSGFLPRLSIVRTIFYNDVISNVIYYTRDNYFRILSTFMEPSYYACYLVAAFFYFLSFKQNLKNNVVLLLLIFVQIILTFSSTAYGAFAILWFIWIVFSDYSIKNKIILFLITILGAMLSCLLFYNILDQVIFSKAKSGSAIARTSWNNRALRVFEENKIIGVGYKMSRASSIIYTLMAETGICGLVSYILLIINFIKCLFVSNKNCIISLKGVTLAILCVMVAQIIAVPDIDNSSYWMWLNLFAVTISLYNFNRSKGVTEYE